MLQKERQSLKTGDMYAWDSFNGHFGSIVDWRHSALGV